MHLSDLSNIKKSSVSLFLLLIFYRNWKDHTDVTEFNFITFLSAIFSCPLTLTHARCFHLVSVTMHVSGCVSLMAPKCIQTVGVVSLDLTCFSCTIKQFCSWCCMLRCEEEFMLWLGISRSRHKLCMRKVTLNQHFGSWSYVSFG